MPTVELRRLADGRWGWIYRGERVVLYSNDVYESAEAAEESAKAAYPGVLLTRTLAEGARESSGGKGGLAFLLMVWAVWRHARRGS